MDFDVRRRRAPWRGNRWRWFLLALVGLFLAAPSAGDAADKYEVGDEVQVLHLGEWRPGTVVEVGRRNEVLVEFEFIPGRAQRQVFRGTDVRPGYEAGALLPTRVWSDASGKFKITAALISVAKDSITLRKPDKTEVTVPIEKLSPADQELLKKAQRAVFAEKGPEPPPLEEFQRDGFLDSSPAWGELHRSLEPDPLPSYLKLQQGGVLFGTDDVFDRMGAVLPVGGPDGWLLAGVENESPKSPKPARVIWASLAKKKVSSVHLLPPDDTIVDYHPPSRQLLTATQSRRDPRAPETLTLWRTSPVDQELTPVVRWNASLAADDRPTFDVPWARIVDAETVVVRAGKNDVLGWDVAAKRLKFRVSQESFFAPVPVLSAGRRYLAVPEDRGVRVYVAATGELVSSFPSHDGASGAAFTEDGRRLAYVGRSTLHVADLSAPSVAVEKFQAEAIGTPFHTNVEWLDSERVLADSLGGRSKVLFSLKHRLPLWNYEFDWNAVRDEKGKRFRHVVAGHLVYAATVREGGASGLVVGAVKLPGPKVDEADQAFDPETLYVIKRGVAMKANIQAGQYNERVWAAVRGIMERNGWTYDANSPITITAEMKQAQPSQVAYRDFRTGATQSATVQPFISTLRIEIGTDAAWQGGTSSGAPPVVRLGQGQSVQGEVDRYQVPRPEYFEQAVVPEKILDPKRRNGLGSTNVTNRGLVPRDAK